MAIEWAWLRSQRPVDLADRGIFLRGESSGLVLLLHGLTGTPTELGFLSHWLRSRGRYGVRCPRLVNHGQPLDVLARTRWRQLYQSAKDAFLEARAAARSEGGRLVVGGLSAGALLSLLLAAEFPDEVAGVVCLAPTFFYDGWSVPWYHCLIPFVDYTPVKRFAFFREDEPFGLRDESLRAKVASRYGKMNLHDTDAAAAYGYAHFPVSLFCEMRHLIRHCNRSLPSVRCPILVVQAEQDDITGPRNAEHLLRRVGSERRELLMLKHSYHLVTVDLERAAVAKRVQEFCGSVLSSRRINGEEHGSAQVAA